MRRNQSRRKPLELGVILLIAELYNVGTEAVPPVTLATIIGQALLYTGIIELPWNPGDICISAHKVWHLRDWKPLIWANFIHGDDMHLYYNMVSFLVKGRTLEERYSSPNFALLLAFLTFFTSGMYVALSMAGAVILEDQSIMSSCAVGFSGVIFALKLITTVDDPEGSTYVAGMRVPTRYAAWAELLAIHYLVPNASFIGHLAGILAGLCYMKTGLRCVVDKVITTITGYPMYHRYW